MRGAGGDFFNAVPGGEDYYLMANILHDWDDERAGFCTMPPHAKVLVIERAILLHEVAPQIYSRHYDDGGIGRQGGNGQ
jgi:hypothetical protein